MPLTEAIKTEARRLGFFLAGVTTPEPPPHWPVFQHWLSMGRNGSMDYLADPRRSDPRKVLPECQSILVLAARYPDPAFARQTRGSRPSGRIASYAWGRDYHLVLPERMQSLSSFIEILAGKPVVHRSYTDTGPILERDLAQRAGLGWIGKNTCLIHPKIGSYFFLSEILLGIELEPDEPFAADRCGKCNRCIEACPTKCIKPDRTIEARLCLSYLTIENKKEIPLRLRPKLGNWVFGCDICQQVCPWNRFSNQGVDPAFQARPGIPNPDLVSELGLTQKEFNHKYKDSPILRSKRRGYLRNIAVALGNSGNQTALQASEAAKLDNELLVREHAAWAVDNLRNHKNTVE